MTNQKTAQDLNDKQLMALYLIRRAAEKRGGGHRTQFFNVQIEWKLLGIHQNTIRALAPSLAIPTNTPTRVRIARYTIDALATRHTDLMALLETEARAENHAHTMQAIGKRVMEAVIPPADTPEYKALVAKAKDTGAANLLRQFAETDKGVCYVVSKHHDTQRRPNSYWIEYPEQRRPARYVSGDKLRATDKVTVEISPAFKSELHITIGRFSATRYQYTGTWEINAVFTQRQMALFTWAVQMSDKHQPANLLQNDTGSDASPKADSGGAI